MRRDHIASPKLQAQIDAYLAFPIKPGDSVEIQGKYLKTCSSKDKSRLETCKVKEVIEDKVIVYNGWHEGDVCEVELKNVTKDTFKIGPNPFPDMDWRRRIRTYNFTLEGIYLQFFKDKVYKEKRKDGTEYQIELLNWNPYVFNKDGIKEFYQRDFCWSIKEKQLLIDSIYNGINCGQILVRRHSWRDMIKEAESNDVVYEFDIVDGKQRLNTIVEFMNNKFPDSYGNYWNDLSDYARYQFEDSHCFTLAEMEEGTTDKDVIKAFLGVNFTGVPMSQEHINFVKEINKKM